MQSMRTALLIAFAFVLAESKSFAKAAYVQLSEMVATCDLIIVARVESVRSLLFGKKHANDPEMTAEQAQTDSLGLARQREPVGFLD